MAVVPSEWSIYWTYRVNTHLCPHLGYATPCISWKVATVITDVLWYICKSKVPQATSAVLFPTLSLHLGALLSNFIFFVVFCLFTVSEYVYAYVYVYAIACN